MGSICFSIGLLDEFSHTSSHMIDIDLMLPWLEDLMTLELVGTGLSHCESALVFESKESLCCSRNPPEP